MGLFDFLKPKVAAPAPVQAPQPVGSISDDAFNLIVASEGLDQPYLFPGGDSGITIGIGDDLGYQTLDEFTKKWASVLPAPNFKLLTTALGIKGIAAAKIAKNFRDIKIDRNTALNVFRQFDIPHYIQQTKAAFPGVEFLCANAFGAMVSLVYNRGSSTSGSRRVEMSNIKTILAKLQSPATADVYKAIAAQFRAMKKLWIGQNLDGLITRREQEAKLIETCL